MGQDMKQILEKTKVKFRLEKIKASKFNQPTIFIGIGGTGVKIVSKIRQKYEREIGVPECVKFLIMDADENELNRAVKNAGFNENKDVVDYSDDELMAMLNNINQDAHKYEKMWFPTEHIPEINTTGADGAGQERPVGRFLFAKKISAIKNKIRKKKEEIDKLKVNDQASITRIFVFSSLAGGTGSGAFLDLAYLIRKVVNAGYELYGVFLMPAVFSSGTAGHSAETISLNRNGYAALKELDYFMKANHKEHEVKYTAEPSLELKFEGSPFDYCILMDSINDQSVRIGNLDEEHTIIAEAMCHLSYPTLSSVYKSIKANHGKISTIVKEYMGESFAVSRYIGLGYASLSIPIHEIMTLLSQQLIDKLYGELKKDLDRDELMFAVDSIQINETSKQQLVTSINNYNFQVMDYFNKIFALDKIEIPDAIDSLDAANGPMTKKLDVEIMNSNASFDDVLQDRINKTKQLAKNWCKNGTKGPFKAYRLFHPQEGNNLPNYIEEARRDLQNDKKNFTTKIGELESIYKGNLTELQNLVDSAITRFFQKNKIRAQTRLCIENQCKISQYKLEIEKAEIALRLFTEYANSLVEINNEIVNNLVAVLDHIKNRVDDEADAIKTSYYSNSRDQESYAWRPIGKLFVDVNDEFGDFLERNKNIKKLVSDFILGLKIDFDEELEPDQIVEKVWKYINERFKDMMNLAIEAYIDEKLDETPGEVLVKLKNNSDVLLNLSSKFFNKSTLLRNAFVIFDDDNCPSFKNAATNFQGYGCNDSAEIVNSPAQHSISVIQTALGIPLYALNLMTADIRKHYHENSNPEYVHSDKNWAELPDFIPDSITYELDEFEIEDLFFAMLMRLGFIYKEMGTWYLKIDEEIELGESLEKAEEEFFLNKNLIEEAEKFLLDRKTGILGSLTEKERFAKLETMLEDAEDAFENEDDKKRKAFYFEEVKNYRTWIDDLRD